MALAAVRGLCFSVEQPVNSLLYFSPSVSASIERTSARRFHFWMGGWGGGSAKPMEMYHTCPGDHIQALHKDFKSASQKIGKIAGKTDNTVVIRQPKKTVPSSSGGDKKGWGGASCWITGNKTSMKD
eukprot:8712621-Pyramimonas_sp.AAC.1